MARKKGEELELLKKKHNVSQLYSWSKYNTYKTSTYEYFLKYVLKTPEDKNNNIYTFSGGASHEIIEKLYLNQIKYEDMINEYEDALFNFNMKELKYDRTDKEKNEKIGKKYEYCMRHFFKNHNIIDKKIDIERFIAIKVNNFLFQGYIDAIHKDGDSWIITDWKTSSIYSGDKINKEKGQLLLYGEGLNQLGVPFENIKIRWNFLKYVTAEVQQANGQMIERNMSRDEIGKSLKTNVKMWLTKAKKYTSDEIEDYLDVLIFTNNIQHLPEDIKEKYVIKDCYVYIPFTVEEIQDLKLDITNTLAEINKKEFEYSKTKDEDIWDEEINDKSSYYFSVLSGYSAKLHKPYGRYLEQFNNFKEQNKDKGEDDLSWLNEV